ncbi:MAG: SUMF1/EgtB/PvdO family nonheme iron enzyme, partial [Verrucomicrobia bacterium]|nr:SUMF1/EgtB/PvdO family nonheme iron enzyme [Verrucomicrobiota bacterium]
RSVPRDRDAVCCVSWNDTVAFCEWLTEHERKAGRLTAGQVVRLPTEAEWEYACRAGTQTKFWWGEAKEGGKERLNWHETGNEVKSVDSFGSRGRNGFGLADMLGNVYEWCLDDYDVKQAHEECYKSKSDGRAMRGGSFGDSPTRCRCAYRSSGSASMSNIGVGFRVVMGVDVSGAKASTPSTSPAAASREGSILAPVETRVSALTTNPKAGEVFTLDVGKGVAMELMGIPPGEFLLGSTKGEQAWANANGSEPRYTKYEGEQPRKAAIKQGIWLGKTEVTVGQWKLFVAATGYVTDGEKNGESFTTQGPGKPWGLVKGANWKDPNFGFNLEDNHAVSCISWNDAIAFCEWLNEREQKAGRLPPGFKVRLPTEVEWEYACRGGKQTKFWWGDAVDDGDNRSNQTGRPDGVAFVAPVDHYGSRGRNKFGLADMLGNVAEWCQDEFDEKGAHEELWTIRSLWHVTRGGAFGGFAVSARCAARGSCNSSKSMGYLGFRVCVGVER